MTNSTACGVKREYYMEWWEVGTDHNSIEMGHFHTGNLRSFLKLFLELKRFTVIYLERVADGKVVRDVRATAVPR
jgi:hypothetical protein